MGMSMIKFYMSWYLFYTILIAIYSLIWTLIVKGILAPDADFLLFYFLYFLTGMFFISLGLFISSFFSRAKPGVLCAIIAFFVLFGVSIATGQISSKNISINTWLTLSPLAGLVSACNVVMIVQSFYQKFGWNLFSKEILNYKYSIWFFFNIWQSVLYVLLGLYLDQVFPKETGVAKHPLFCFKKSNSKKKLFQRVVNLIFFYKIYQFFSNFYVGTY
jgi:ATP-binding cassette, subfamily A (ABC1), member 3